MGLTPRARPVNLVSCEDDPGKIQPHVGLDEFLMSAATASVDDIFTDCIRDRNFDMKTLFPPKVIGLDDDEPNPFLTPFLNAINPEINNAFGRVDCFPTIMDPMRCPSNLLDALLFQYGSPFTLEEGLTDNEKRRLVSLLFTLYSLAGTCFGVIGAIRILYSINVTECVQPNIDCWVLGESELNLTTFLCPTSASERRSFRIMVDVTLIQTQRDQITNIVDWMKPANTHFEGIIEPFSPGFIDHWELDVSELNINTFLH